MKTSIRSGAVTVEVETDTSGLRALLANAVQRAAVAAQPVCEQWRGETTAYMKEHAPWQDVTGDARASLGVVPEYGERSIKMHLTGGVPYMRFLELDQAGKFGILADATHLWGHILLERLKAERV